MHISYVNYLNETRGKTPLWQWVWLHFALCIQDEAEKSEALKQNTIKNNF